MVFNATFNNISVILWKSVLLVEETGVHGENHQPVASQVYHIMLCFVECVDILYARRDSTETLCLGINFFSKKRLLFHKF